MTDVGNECAAFSSGRQGLGAGCRWSRSGVSLGVRRPWLLHSVVTSEGDAFYVAKEEGTFVRPGSFAR